MFLYNIETDKRYKQGGTAQSAPLKCQASGAFFQLLLIIFSKVSLDEIKQIFNEPEDIFPSDIGEETDFSRPTFLIDDNGELIPGAKLFGEDCFVYYCWWD